MNEQYVTLVGKVCAPKYENAYTPEVISQLPIEASSEGRRLKDWILYGNSNPNCIEEAQNNLPIEVSAYSGNATDWEIYGNNNPVVENKTSVLPIDVSATAGNIVDYTIEGNNNSNKNKIDLSNTSSTTINDVIVTVDSTLGVIIVNGINTGSDDINIRVENFPAPAPGEYYFSGCPAGGTIDTYYIIPYDVATSALLRKWNGTTSTGNDYGTGAHEILITNTTVLRFTIRIKSGYQANNLVFSPMLWLGTLGADSPFEPYQTGVGEKTKNLLPILGFTDINKNNVVMTADVAVGTVSVYTTDAPSASTQSGIEFKVSETGNYLLSGIPSTAPNGDLDMYCWDIAKNQRARAWDQTSSSQAVTRSRAESEIYLEAGVLYKINIRTMPTYGTQTTPVIVSPMVRKSGASSDFVKCGYQVPISAKQRTKNIFEIVPTDQIVTETGTVHFTIDADAGTITANGTAGSSASSCKQRFTVTSETAGDYYFSTSFNATGSTSTFDGYMYDNTASAFITKWDGTTQSPTIKGAESQEVKLIEGHTVEVTFRIFMNTVVDNLIFKPMLRSANTAADFEPYYSTNKTDVFIGNAPLTANQSINKTQSGQDITLFSGNNIIDTTLYNVPNTSITYNSSVLGVGERTKNIIDLTNIAAKTSGNVTMTPDATTGFVIVVTTEGDTATANCTISNIYLPVGISGNYYLSGCPNGGNETSTYDIYPWDETVSARPMKWDGTTEARSSIDDTPQEVQFVAGHIYRIDVRVRSGATVNGLVFKPMIRKADTTSDFVPFGYQIPLTVISGQATGLYNYYIGNSPLAAGQSISKTSTGTDIALLSGTNTISTTMGNKPEMRVEYESSVLGIGERTKNMLDLETADVDREMTIITKTNSTGELWATTTGGKNYIGLSMRPPFEDGKSYTISFNNLYTDNTLSRVTIRRNVSYTIRYSVSLVNYGERSLTFTYTNSEFPDGAYVSIILNNNTGAAGEMHIENLMLRESNTTPLFELYGYKIPIKVKGRTKNLLNIGDIDTTLWGIRYYNNNGCLMAVGKYTDNAAHSQPRFYCYLDAGSYSLSGSPDYNSTNIRVLVGTCDDMDGTNFTTLGYDQGMGYSFTLESSSWVSVRIYTAKGLYNNDVNLTIPLMLRRTDTSADFEPYYGNPTQADIYIGSQPLVSNTIVSRNDTNTEVELNEGMNQITTDLYNKPEMYIK